MTSHDPPENLVRIYADSLGMPRVTDGIPWHATYSEELRRGLEVRTGRRQAVFGRSRGGATTPELYEMFNADRFYLGPAGGVLVVQAGIVDCAPRPVPRVVRDVISRLPSRLRGPIIHQLHVHRRTLVRLGPMWRMTRPERFRAILQRWLTVAVEDAETVLVVNIAPTVDAIEHHSPGLTASIEDFNELIRDAVDGFDPGRVRLVDVHDAIFRDASPVDTFINRVDGHHLTREGHRLYGRLLTEAATAAF